MFSSKFASFNISDIRTHNDHPTPRSSLVPIQAMSRIIILNKDLEFQTRLTPGHPVNKTNQTNQIIRIHNGLPDLTWFHWSLSRAAFRDIILERALNR